MLTLTYRGTSLVPVEAPCVTPDHLAGKTAAEVERLTVYHGNREEPLGEFFSIDGDADDGHVVVRGDCSRVKWLGTGMTRGRLTVEGDAGMHLGAEMAGGEVEVTGNASDWVGAEMSGGLIRVRGDAGHLVGAVYRGGRRGMRGGAILVHGRAGNEVGATMRRGLIAVGGECGDFAGVSLIAGTVLLFGPAGIRHGAGMKRGTIGLFGGDAPLLPTFRYDCTYRPVFLSLYLRQLTAWGFPVPELSAVRRYSGDLLALGKGEVLLPAV